ncbi:uncharacterized protein LOC127239869 [Andrographis paniculata]|uniref:uncharacterized protein LOC127239869 n=1 Tax=Andrographis paniculata TaxID=175694 RepID=UPI0021E78055|nr:uncharacterized protein LOC127239869 [Andrographis paniculata]
MATTGEGFLRGILLEGCISSGDSGVQRRPYHRNCSCALHQSRRRCHHASRCATVAYPIRRSWSDGCLSLSLSLAAEQYSPNGSPRGENIPRTATLLELCIEDHEDEDQSEVTWPKI